MSTPVASTAGPLHLDDADLSVCVSCGLCLPHCPTYRATGEEGLSPRGRIDAMRSVQWRGAPIDDGVLRFWETCVQCRGCEPACPSGVPFGRLIEGTKDALATSGTITPRRQRLALRALSHHRLLLAGSTLLAVAQRLHLVPRRLGLPRLPLRRGRRGGSVGGDVWLFTGCVMDAWLRPTHQATTAVLEAAGATVSWSPGDAGCCGALARPCRAARRGPQPRPSPRRRAAGRRTGARQLRRVRRGDEGLRPPPRHARGEGVRRQGARRPRVARRARRPAAAGDRAAPVR